MAQTSKQEIAKVDEAWCKSHLSTILAKQSRVQPTPQEENKTFNFNKKDSPIVTSKQVIMPPFICMLVKGNTDIKGLFKRVNLCAEPVEI